MKKKNEKLSTLVFLVMVLSALYTVDFELSMDTLWPVIQTVVLYMIIFKMAIFAIKKIQGWINH